MNEEPDPDRILYVLEKLLWIALIIGLVFVLNGCQTTCEGKSIWECSHTARAANQPDRWPKTFRCKDGRYVILMKPTRKPICERYY